MLVVPKDQHECKITNKCQRFTPPKVTTQVGLSYSPMHKFPRCNQRE